MTDTDTAPMETWEIQTAGALTVWKRDKRSGDYRKERVAATGPKRLRLSRDDREYNQELIPEENAHLDPFTNGMLAQVVGKKLVGITREEIIGLLEIKDEAFVRAIAEIDNELTIRRLLELAESDGTVAQVAALREVIDERYRVGGTQRTVREMLDEEDKSGGEVLTG